MFKLLKSFFKREEFDLLAAESSVQGLPLFQQIASGSFAGVCEHLGLFPIDTIKTNMQASEGTHGFFRTIGTLYKEEGLTRFYRGALPIVLGCIPAHGAFFATYEFTKAKFHTNDEKYHFLADFFTGAFAATVHDTILTPLDCNLLPKTSTSIEAKNAIKWVQKAFTIYETRAKD